MNTLQSNYQAVINDVAADIDRLKRNGQPCDTVAVKLLQKRHQWLVCRKDKLNERRELSGSGFNHTKPNPASSTKNTPFSFPNKKSLSLSFEF